MRGGIQGLDFRLGRIHVKAQSSRLVVRKIEDINCILLACKPKKNVIDIRKDSTRVGRQRENDKAEVQVKKDGQERTALSKASGQELRGQISPVDNWKFSRRVVEEL